MHQNVVGRREAEAGGKERNGQLASQNIANNPPAAHDQQCFAVLGLTSRAKFRAQKSRALYG